jgi:SulP family sulfate permease
VSSQSLGHQLRLRLRALAPQRADYAELPSSWRRDVLAGVTVGIVALPLALAFGIASGLGAAAGIVTAIVAGVLAGVFGGSNVQVSGPTGAMVVVLAPIVAQFGAAGVALVTLLAGLLLIGCAIARLGRFVGFLPWPVIEGFTVGIGLIIFFQQVPLALGLEVGKGENTLLFAGQSLLDAVAAFGPTQLHTLVLTSIVVLAMLALPRVHRSLPASLIGVVVATLTCLAVGWKVPTIGAIPSALPAPALPAIQLGELSGLIGAVFAVAALAAIESLLSAKVADGMTDGAAHNPDRELFGQGIASTGAALFGGMPATGAIARTAVNVRAGARTRVSAIVHALLLIVVVVALSPVIAEIPIAALAGVLMVTAIHMVEFGSVARIMRSTRGDAAVMFATTFATIAFDLIVAVEVGVVLAGLLALRKVALDTSFEVDQLDGEEIDAAREAELLGDHVVAYRIDGALFFGASERFLLELTDISDVDFVILRLVQLRVLDATGAQALKDLIERLRHRGIIVLLTCVRPDHRRLLAELGVIDALGDPDRVAPTIHDALVEIDRIRSQPKRNRLNPPAPIPSIR